MSTLLLISLLASSILLTGSLIFLLILIWYALTLKVPFIRIPKEILPSIEKALALNEKSVAYDLGCGDGRVLFYLFQKNPNAKYFGVEKNLFAYCLAKWKIKSQNPKIIFGDLFDCNLSEATHIFTYLFPSLLNQLLPKLKKELKPGAMLVSCDYPFKDMNPENIINLNRLPHSLGQRIYIYKF